MKKCPCCGHEKPVTEFYVHSGGGYQTSCKLCQKKTAKEKRLLKPAEVRKAEDRAYRKLHRDRINLAKRIRRLSNPEQVQKEALQRKASFLANPEKIRDSARKWRAKNPGHRLQHAYGISIEDWNRMHAEQNGACAICKKTVTGTWRSGFYVDHNHSTGKVRALLCSACNTAVGMVRESVSTAEALVEYLKKHS